MQVVTEWIGIESNNRQTSTVVLPFIAFEAHRRKFSTAFGDIDTHT
jgi:hypothetical protein